MHALTILHRILSTRFPEIHAKRLTCLLAAVESVVTGSRLTLSDMGRGLHGKVAVKHNIKRIDRLLGNDSLHTEIPKLYKPWGHKPWGQVLPLAQVAPPLPQAQYSCKQNRIKNTGSLIFIFLNKLAGV
jgi:hypothetical protein